MINLFQGSGRDVISSRRSSKSLVIPAVVESLEFRRLFSVEYSITDLGTLGGSDSSANAINASGQVVGTADNASGVSEAFIDTDGVMTNLGILPGGTGSNALAINASGEVVGEAVTSSGATNAVEFTGGNVVDLGTDGLSGSAAEGINDAGTIVGGLIITTNQLSPFIYSNGTFTILPTPAVINENSLGLAAGINDAGQIVGNYGNSFEQDGTPTIDEPYPYSWNASQQGGIAPLVPGYDEGLILAINSTGQGAGFGEKPSGDSNIYEAAIWGSSVTPLGTLSGAQSSVAYALNDNVDVVGSSSFSDGTQHAFLYQGNGSQTMLDLNDLIPTDSGWVLNKATGINDKGQICGVGEIDGVSHAFLLTPMLAAPADLTASQGTAPHHVALTWAAVSGAASYQVFRSTTDDVSTAVKIVGGLTTTSYDDTTAVPGTLYYYWVAGRNSSGVGSFSAAASGYIPVAAPTGVAATTNLAHHVAVTWAADIGAVTYQVFRSTTDVFSGATRIAAGITTTFFDDTTAVFGTDYFYWVRAKYALGVSAESIAVSGNLG